MGPLFLLGKLSIEKMFQIPFTYYNVFKKGRLSAGLTG